MYMQDLAHPETVSTLCSIAAHEPVDGHNERFGQLTMQAEIWNLCFDPEGFLLHVIDGCLFSVFKYMLFFFTF